MEVFASAAAVLQVLGQAVAVLQEVSQVREAIRAAPKTLEDAQMQLFGLERMVKDISLEPSLQNIPTITTVLSHIVDIGQDLVHILMAMKNLRQRSKMYQNVYMLIKRQRDEARLRDVLDRLGRSKVELGIEINVAHVRMTDRVAAGVQNIEKKVQLAVKKEHHHHLLRLEENKAMEDSDQVNGILGLESLGVSTTASVARNASYGNSRQKNLILAGPAAFRPLKVVDT
ncbi:hypothetical protein MFIFM68171_08110 [Madurella fahalii]|uniref:NACHT-NTPase and P-loop NTPases N-terminal domain-containing protein n=1 Tax=Madurella fahalii TaxID=1157608 RepID=A0ABQ0GJG1_9PEZI